MCDFMVCGVACQEKWGDCKDKNKAETLNREKGKGKREM